MVPPTPSDRKKCTVHELRDGDWLCFTQGWSGPLTGASTVAYSANGTLVEFQVPITALLRNRDTDESTVRIRSSVSVQLVLESTAKGCADATSPFAYELGPGGHPVSLEAAIVIPIATFLLGVVAVTVVACICFYRRSKSKEYSQIQ